MGTDERIENILILFYAHEMFIDPLVETYNIMLLLNKFNTRTTRGRH